MAFISLFFAFVFIFLALSAAGIILIIIGTVLIKKNKKKSGTALRIIGMILLIPIVFLIISYIVYRIKLFLLT